MKEFDQRKNYFKNQYYRLKIEPFVDFQVDHVKESDLKQLHESNGNNHLLKFKINPIAYTFFIKAEQIVSDYLIVDIEDYVMTIMQLFDQSNHSYEYHEDFLGFAHSFVIPESIKLDEIRVYDRSNILLIIIPRR